MELGLAARHAVRIHTTFTERRREPRFAVSEPVEVMVLDADTAFSGRTLDASESGLSLAIPSPLRVGTHLKLELPGAVMIGYVCNCRTMSGGPFECAVGIIIKYVFFGWKEFYARVRSADNRVALLPKENAVFNELIAGSSPQELQPGLTSLSSEARQAVLCTACFLIEEIAVNCEERAANIAEVITANCQHYQGGVRTCAKRFIEELVSIN